MFTLTLRTLRANKVRLALTTFAVVLGVSFIVSSFVLGDGLRREFTSLSEEIVGGVDVEVRPTSDFGSASPLPETLAADIQAIEGVRTTAGSVASEGIQPITPDGPITTSGAPLIGMSWIDDPQLSSFSIIEGRPPSSGLEFSIDRTSAESNRLVLGTTYPVITPAGRFDVELVGISRFGENNETVGAVLTQFPLSTAQELFGRTGQLDTISVAYDRDADRAAVLADIDALLPDLSTAVEQDQLLTDVTGQFTSGVDIFNNIMLGFAGVALFVSIFIIANTFAIVLGQRTKELALLRAIGASPAQIRGSAMAEALIVGIVASALGIIGGIGLALGLQVLFEALGAGLPESDLVLARRTIVSAVVVGVGVTVLSSIGPARRASRVAPLAALQESIDVPRNRDRRTTLVGMVVLVVGLLVGSAGLFVDIDGTAQRIVILSTGALLTFLGAAAASPAAARPVIRMLGLPLRALGTAGTLSTQNAGRSPRRTASTASSLMIGLALVTTALVVGESIKQSISETLAGEVRADYITSSDTPLNDELLADLEASVEFGAVSGYRYDEIRVGGATRSIAGADATATDQLFDLGLISGEISDDPSTVAVQSDEAEARDLAVGDRIDIEFPSGSVETLTVAAVFENNTVIDTPYLLSEQAWHQRFGDHTAWWAAAMIADGVSAEEAAAAMAEVSSAHPQVTFESQVEFKQTIEAEIDQLLVIINAMLVLAVLVALIGIANTMALSVHERTREIGLLRAVGMARRQARRMIRWEAAQVAVFGSILGIGLGLLFGIGVTKALPDSFVSTLAFPVARIALLVVICGVSGLMAAALPARRAAKLDVLAAIGHA